MFIRMNKEQVFLQKVEEIKQIAKKQNNMIEAEQLHQIMGPLEFEENQLQILYDYLKSQKIGIDEEVDLDDYLSHEDVNFLAMYLEDISHTEAMSPGVLEATILSAMAGEKQAAEKLIEQFLSQVVDISKLYVEQGVLIEDLIGEGNVALALTVSMLGCAEHAKDAEQMLVQAIMEAMEKYIVEYQKQSEEDLKAANRVNEITERAKDLAESLHKKVSPSELAEETGLNVEDIVEAMRLSGDKIEFLEEN